MKAGKWAALATVTLAAVFLYTQTTAAPAAADAKAELGKPAPDFTLKDVYGKPFKLSDFKGKIVVLEWINRSCPISRKCSDPTQKKVTMQVVYGKYAEKGVVWLAIDTTHTAKPEDNRVYAAEKGLAYPILHDPDGKVGKTYGAKTTPHMFVIDKAAKLVYSGAIDDHSEKNYVAAALDDLLAGKPVAKTRTESYGCSVKYRP